MTGIQPELWVDRPTEAVAFYGAAFGARVLHQVGEGDDIVAQLAVGDAAFWVSPGGADGPRFTHRGTAELRSLFTEWFGAGGGIRLECCAVTDDDVRCALEYNCVSWGGHTVSPQAGLGVYERGPDGLLAAARFYDDIEAPVR